MDPKGKIALVTGGASGLGLGVVKELLRQGVQGVSICDVNVTKGEKEVKQLQQEFGEGRAAFIKTDVTKQDESEAAFEQTIKQFGGLDIVFNNAGVFNDRNWEQCVSVNVNGIIRIALLAFKYMGKDQGGKGGVLVNTGSIASLAGGMQITAIYSATKCAVLGLSRSLGCDFLLKTTGIRTMCVCPGYTATEILNAPRQEPVILTVNENWMPEFDRQLADHPPPQSTENVGKAVLHMICKGKNGSMWVSESEEPPYEINIPPHDKLRV